MQVSSKDRVLHEVVWSLRPMRADQLDLAIGMEGSKSARYAVGAPGKRSPPECAQSVEPEASEKLVG